jgi:hypothetical protein
MAFPESASRNFNIRGALSSVNENHYSKKSLQQQRSSAIVRLTNRPSKPKKCPTFTGMGAG